MGFIIEGKKLHVEVRNESFYIAINKLKHELLDIIEISYNNFEEVKELINAVEDSARYKSWKETNKK